MNFPATTVASERRGQEALDRAGLPFLGEEPHRDDRGDDHQEDPLEDVREVERHHRGGRRLGAFSAFTRRTNTVPLTSRNAVRMT